MLKEKDALPDDSPTEELPILTEQDAVDATSPMQRPEWPGASVVDAPSSREPLPRHAESAADIEATGSFFMIGEGTNDEATEAPFPATADVEARLARLTGRIADLEALVADKDTMIASLDERLRATRDAVARREDAARRLAEQLSDAMAHVADAERRLAEVHDARDAAEARANAAAEQARELDARLAESDALAAMYAERVTELTRRLRTLELSANERDRVFAELEAELIDREARAARRERELDEAEKALVERTAAFEETAQSDDKSKLRKLQTALERSREEAAALAAYIDRRRAYWLELQTQLREQQTAAQELERELAQRADRERRERERAATEARRAEQLAAELAAARARLAADKDRVPLTDRSQLPPSSPRIDDASPIDTKPLDAKLPSNAEPPEATTARQVAAPPLVPALLCLTSTPPREYLLRDRRTTIGRGPECGIRIVANFVSREHARVIRSGADVQIEDLDSRNGVFVNAVRIAREVLRDGDLVTIGEMQFRYRAG